MSTRLKANQVNLNRILKDDRIPGSRRILAQILKMWIEAEGEDRKVLTAVLLGTFGGQRIRWADGDESAVTGQETTKLDIETRTQIKDALAQILGEEN
jgi:hypothetical protein